METRIYRNYLSNEVSLMSILDVSLSSLGEIPWKDPSSPEMSGSQSPPAFSKIFL